MYPTYATYVCIVLFLTGQVAVLITQHSMTIPFLSWGLLPPPPLSTVTATITATTTARYYTAVPTVVRISVTTVTAWRLGRLQPPPADPASMVGGYYRRAEAPTGTVGVRCGRSGGPGGSALAR